MNTNPQKTTRTYIPINFIVENWNGLQPFFTELLNRNINNKTELETWLLNLSELQAVISEDACWRQIKMTCDTTNKELEDAYTFWCTDIQPNYQTASDAINKKLLACTFIAELDKNLYNNYLRSVEKDIKIFTEKNVELQSKESMLAQQFGSISSKMSIEVNEKEYTLQQAAKFLKQSDRNLREEVFTKVANRRLQNETELNKLFDKLLNIRAEIATNAGFDNYRDYKFTELGRLDYTQEDCFAFHDAIKKYILPLVDKIYAYKKTKLQLPVLKPWDVDAEPIGTIQLDPFIDGKDLIEKSIAVFNQLNPDFGKALKTMQSMNHLDLDSRKGKAPGGYNCPLAETGVPFIFMNAAGTADDVITMMHEGGHAMHSFLCHDLQLSAFKEYSMEMAELASMSMELMSMNYWDIFYKNKEELNRAKAEELERVLTILPWIAIIDKFQHWLYTNVGHTIAQRTEKWNNIVKEFSTAFIDWTGFEHYHSIYWQKQLHLFEVPFYYIEYGIAQLGAIGMWKQFNENPNQALHNYQKALSLGYTKGLKELYQTAGIDFDFSKEKVNELSSFVNEEMEKIIL